MNIEKYTFKKFEFFFIKLWIFGVAWQVLSLYLNKNKKGKDIIILKIEIHERCDDRWNQ